MLSASKVSPLYVTVTFHGYAFAMASFASARVMPVREMPFTRISSDAKVVSITTLLSGSALLLFFPESMWAAANTTATTATAAPPTIRRSRCTRFFLIFSYENHFSYHTYPIVPYRSLCIHKYIRFLIPCHQVENEFKIT